MNLWVLCATAFVVLLLPSDGPCLETGAAVLREKRWTFSISNGGGGRGGGGRGGGRRGGGRRRGKRADDLENDVAEDTPTSLNDLEGPVSRVQRSLSDEDLTNEESRQERAYVSNYNRGGGGRDMGNYGGVGRGRSGSGGRGRSGSGGRGRSGSGGRGRSGKGGRGRSGSGGLGRSGSGGRGRSGSGGRGRSGSGGRGRSRNGGRGYYGGGGQQQGWRRGKRTDDLENDFAVDLNDLQGKRFLNE